jgi:sugar phosphate isomerase/epimerase
MGKVRFSTGTFTSNLSIFERIEFLIEQGVHEIELSGGNHEEKWLSIITRFPQVDFSFHNYFPPPETPFVFNLASPDSIVREKSIRLCKQGIRLSSKFSQKQFSFHAGFCFDPIPSSLGLNLQSASPTLDIDSANEIFSRSIEEIASFAEENNVVPLVENNVLTEVNASKLGRDSLLLTNSYDIHEF